MSDNHIPPQLQLRQTRNEFRALMIELQTDSFPRSMTMKLLMGAGGQSALAYLLGRGRAASMPVSIFGRVIRSAVMSTLIKKLWSRLRN